MPRQVDLFPQNLQVTHDPTNQIAVTSAQINHLNAQLPAKIAEAQAQAIVNFLQQLDQETGLDLLGLWNGYLALVDAIEAGLTSSFNGIESALAQLVSNASDAWTQIEDFLLTGDWADLSTAWTDIFGTAQEAEANWQTLFTELGFSVSTATQLADFLSGVSNTASNALTPSSALNASNLWGLIPTKVVGSVASTAVVDASPNPLLNPNFESAISVSPGSGWVWDSTVYFTPPSGDTSPGSAKVVADGVLHALRSNLIPVSAGQSLTVSLPVLTSGVTGSGSPIAFHVVTYVGDTPSGITPVAAIAVPTGATTGWVNPPTGSKGGTLTGTYVVASGVTQVQLRLVVDTTATAGTVRFGNAASSLSGGFLANLQTDTNDVIDSLSPGGTAAEFVTGIQNLLALFGLSKSSLGSATDLTAFWTAVVTDFINPLNALEISAIDGLGSALSALLGTTTFQSLLDGIANVMGHSGTGHTITNIETYLGLIPPANVTNVLGGANLGADVSSVHTTATNGTSWATRLTNDLLILLDVFHLTYTSTQYTNAWNDLMSLFGVVNSTSAPTNPTPTIGTSITAAQSAASTAQTTVNTTNTVLFNTTTPTTTNQVQAAAVQGTQGIQDISTTIQHTWDSIATAVAQALGFDVTTSDNPLSAVADVLGQHAVQTGNAVALSSSNSDSISEVIALAPQPMVAGSMPTMVNSVAPLSQIAQNVTTYIQTSSKGYGSYTTFVQDAKIDSITFIAALATASAPTGLYVIFYTVDPTTGRHTGIVNLGNLVGSLASYPGSAAAFVHPYVTVALPSEISVSAGQTLCVAFYLPNTGGSNGVNLGMVNQYAPPLTGQYPTVIGAQIVLPSGFVGVNSFNWLSPANLTPGTLAPWVAFNGPGEIYQPPLVRKITTTQTITAPTWARFVDVVPLGGGGSGGAGVGVTGIVGNATTVVCGSDSVTAAGGARGAAGNSAFPTDAYGVGPGNKTFDNQLFPGGYTVAQQQQGSYPGGGGGAGVAGSLYGFGGSPGAWNPVTWTLIGGESITITVGAGADAVSGNPYGCQAGAAGLAYLVFRAQ